MRVRDQNRGFADCLFPGSHSQFARNSVYLIPFRIQQDILDFHAGFFLLRIDSCYLYSCIPVFCSLLTYRSDVDSPQINIYRICFHEPYRPVNPRAFIPPALVPGSRIHINGNYIFLIINHKIRDIRFKRGITAEISFNQTAIYINDGLYCRSLKIDKEPLSPILFRQCKMLPVPGVLIEKITQSIVILFLRNLLYDIVMRQLHPLPVFCGQGPFIFIAVHSIVIMPACRTNFRSFRFRLHIACALINLFRNGNVPLMKSPSFIPLYFFPHDSPPFLLLPFRYCHCIFLHTFRQ